jgi:hypothetical protein
MIGNKRQTQKPQTQQRRAPVVQQPIPTNFRQSNISYSDATKKIQPTTNSVGTFDINSEIMKYFGKDLATCLGKVNTFRHRFDQLVNEEDKRNALFGIMFELCPQ